MVGGAGDLFTCSAQRAYVGSVSEPIGKLRPSEFAGLARPAQLMTASYGQSEKHMGPLTVSATNPRYFADASGRVVYLGGAHTWNNLVDMDTRFHPARSTSMPI